jgi:hypothetical protein
MIHEVSDLRDINAGVTGGDQASDSMLFCRWSTIPVLNAFAACVIALP